MLVNATQVVSIYRSGYFFLKVEQKSSPGMQVWTMWEPDQKHVLQHVEFVLWSSSSSHHHDTYALSALSKYFQIQMAFIATIKKANFAIFCCSCEICLQSFQYEASKYFSITCWSRTTHLQVQTLFFKATLLFTQFYGQVVWGKRKSSNLPMITNSFLRLNLNHPGFQLSS